MTALRITDIPIFAGNFLTSVKLKKKTNFRTFKKGAGVTLFFVKMTSLLKK